MNIFKTQQAQYRASQAATDARGDALPLSPTLSAFALGFSGCMAGESFEEAKPRGRDYLRGWWAGLDAEAEANMPVAQGMN